MILAALLLASRFHIQTNFWVNLHQRLIHEAATGQDTIKTANADERAAWNAAVDAYRQYAQRDLFDPEVILIHDQLSGTRGDTLPSLPLDVRAALTRAAPVYRREQWDSDRRFARFHIVSLEDFLEENEEELVREHQRVYDRRWTQHVIVDTAPFAGPVGGFTTGNIERAHTTIAISNPTYRDKEGLEMLFHESSHAVFDAELVSNRAKFLGLPAPSDLWHAIIFYTSGELTKRALAKHGVKDYRPVAYKLYVYNRGEYPKYLPLLETIWQQHIDGKIGRDEAIDAMIKKLNQK